VSDFYSDLAQKSQMSHFVASLPLGLFAQITNPGLWFSHCQTPFPLETQQNRGAYAACKCIKSHQAVQLLQTNFNAHCVKSLRIVKKH
ncbi:hypothetical protein, partial [Pantoea agglomerans]|uniref:hypothetical protein n=1 Tax=Enterobacter agglomerans TaxID=549 RepID=UPI001BB3161E